MPMGQPPLVWWEGAVKEGTGRAHRKGWRVWWDWGTQRALHSAPGWRRIPALWSCWMASCSSSTNTPLWLWKALLCRATGPAGHTLCWSVASSQGKHFCPWTNLKDVFGMRAKCWTISSCSPTLWNYLNFWSLPIHAYEKQYSCYTTAKQSTLTWSNCGSSPLWRDFVNGFSWKHRKGIILQLLSVFSPTRSSLKFVLKLLTPSDLSEMPVRLLLNPANGRVIHQSAAWH